MLKPLLKKYLNSNVFILMGGTLLSQLLPLLISPILTRLYTPEEFGMFGLYFSISMIVSVFITGRYEMAIILPNSDNESANLVGLSLLITVIISIVIFFIVLFLKHPIALLLNSEKIENTLFLIPVTTLAIGFYQTFNYWNNRKERYKRMALSRVARSFNSCGASVALGFASFKSAGLIIGDTIGQLVASCFLFFRTWKEDKNIFKLINKKGMREQAIRYQHFPKFNVVSGLFEKMSGHLPVLMLAAYYGGTVTGLFSFSQRIISAPSTIVARAVGDVFRKKAIVEYQNNGNCATLFNTTFIQLSFFGFIPFLLFYIFAPELFLLLFGAQWEEAGRYSRIMTIMFYLQFIVSPLSNMFLVVEKQKIDLFIQISLFVFVLLAFTCGYEFFKSPQVCIFLFTFVYSCKYIVELYLSYKFSREKK